LSESVLFRYPCDIYW